MKNLFVKMIVALTILYGSFSVNAGLYIGAGGYSSNVDETIFTSQIDESDVIQGAFIGWRPIEFAGVELGYFDLGAFSSDDRLVDIDAKAATLAALLSMEIGPVGAYGKLGAAQVSVDIDLANLDFQDKSKNELFGGAGLSVDVMDKLYVYAEVLYFDTDISFDLAGAGLRWEF